MRYISAEEFGFPRSLFPLRFRGHNLSLVHNDAQLTDEGRLSYHFTLYCKKCEEEHTVRGRLPAEHSKESRTTIPKLLVLGHFRGECGA